MTPAPTRRNGQKRPYHSPEMVSLQTARLDQQKDDADGDEYQRAKDGVTAQATHLVTVGFTLSAEHVALSAGLFF